MATIKRKDWINVYDPKNEDWRALFAALLLSLPEGRATIPRRCLDRAMRGGIRIEHVLRYDALERDIIFAAVTDRVASMSLADAGGAKPVSRPGCAPWP